MGRCLRLSFVVVLSIALAGPLAAAELQPGMAWRAGEAIDVDLPAGIATDLAACGADRDTLELPTGMIDVTFADDGRVAAVRWRHAVDAELERCTLEVLMGWRAPEHATAEIRLQLYLGSRPLGRMGEAAGGPSISGIADVVRAQVPAMEQCFQRRRLDHPRLGGKVVIHFLIEPAGTVAFAAATIDTLGDPVMVHCVQERVAKVQFPAGGGPTVVNYPFLFAATPSAIEGPGAWVRSIVTEGWVSAKLRPSLVGCIQERTGFPPLSAAGFDFVVGKDGGLTRIKAQPGIEEVLAGPERRCVVKVLKSEVELPPEARIGELGSVVVWVVRDADSPMEPLTVQYSMICDGEFGRCGARAGDRTDLDLVIVVGENGRATTIVPSIPITDEFSTDCVMDLLRETRFDPGPPRSGGLHLMFPLM